MKPVVLETQDDEDARVARYMPRRAANRVWNHTRERITFQSIKLKGVEDLKSILTSDMKMQSLEFAQIVLGLALAQYFCLLPFLLCGMVIYILCHYILKVCDLLFDFNLTGDYS